MSVAGPSVLRRVVSRILVTGGCGFVGCNIADALARRGDRVLILDSFARSGSEENAAWLRRQHGDRIAIEAADVRDADAVDQLVGQSAAVMHLAGQVAVTTSLDAPVEDFEINARGALNVLEAARKAGGQIPVVFASTNKVYGKLLRDEDIVYVGDRYQPAAVRLALGVDETAPLDFYSPYGCSKGTADQYVRDYARVFGLRTAVLRMSCIYGPRQFGTEDQGWIAHFLIRAIRGEPITIYGDGYQVRDALFVDDAVRAWLAVARRHRWRVRPDLQSRRRARQYRELARADRTYRGTARRAAAGGVRHVAAGRSTLVRHGYPRHRRGPRLGAESDFHEGLAMLENWLRHRFDAGEPALRYGTQA